MIPTQPAQPPPTGQLNALLDEAGLHGPATLQAVTGGRNNRAWRMDLANGARYFLKEYFSHPLDPRDRLRAEWEFAQFAWKAGLRTLARPVATHPSARLALYEFIDGVSFSPGEIGRNEVQAAIDFLTELNLHRFEPGSRSLANAAESQFSLANHLQRVEGRLRRMDDIPDEDDISREVRDFCSTVLRPTFREIAKATTSAARSRGENPEEPLPAHSRIISPSDFGFHNALRRPTLGVVFLDFEYAGWDDPGKTLGDFFAQPAVPIPDSFWNEMLSQIARAFSWNPSDEARCTLHRPIHTLKWASLVLNEFLPTDRSRRVFADADALRDSRLRKQLALAREKTNAAIAQMHCGNAG
jgi:hypothetical protein